jgi:hypothetical protein
MVLDPLNLKITVLWDVVSCSLVEIYQHFVGAYCLPSLP